MFEDSLVESRVGQVSSSKRWTMVAIDRLQLAVARRGDGVASAASGGACRFGWRRRGCWCR